MTVQSSSLRIPITLRGHEQRQQSGDYPRDHRKCKNDIEIVVGNICRMNDEPGPKSGQNEICRDTASYKTDDATHGGNHAFCLLHLAPLVSLPNNATNSAVPIAGISRECLFAQRLRPTRSA